METEGHVVAIDPGGETGLAWLPFAALGWKNERLTRETKMQQIKGDEIEQAPKLALGLMRLHARVVVLEVSDHFLLRAHFNLRKYALIPVRLHGVAIAIVGINNDLASHQRERKDGLVYDKMILETQTPEMGKGILTNERLMNLGYERKEISGKNRHQGDAVKHLRTWIRRYNEKAVIRKRVEEGLR
jgi:hypothetical protein